MQTVKSVLFVINDAFLFFYFWIAALTSPDRNDRKSFFWIASSCFALLAMTQRAACALHGAVLEWMFSELPRHFVSRNGGRGGI
jgi:hypothetical protein